METPTTMGVSLNRYFDSPKKKLKLAFQELQDEFSEILRQHVKRSHTRMVAQKKSTKDYFYTLDFSANQQPSPRPYSQLDWRTSFGFVLCASRLSQTNLPIAIVGFDIEKNCLIIRQLSDTRIQNIQEMLHPIKWERLLCKLVTLFAHSLNIRMVSICSFNSQYQTTMYDSRSFEKLNEKSIMAKTHSLYLRYCQIFQTNELEWNHMAKMYTFRILP